MSNSKTTPEALYENADDMPADACFEAAAQTDDELLSALLDAPDEVTKQVYIKRFGKYFTVKAITSEEYNRLEKQCKYPVKNTRTHQIEEKVDQDKLSYLLVATACTKPNWKDPRLLKKYDTMDAATVVKKRLFIGEVSELSQSIMDVSGFNDGIEEIKNS